MVNSGVPFIRGTNLVDGHISDADILYISKEKHQNLKKGHLKEGDVLFTNRGEIGKVAIVDKRFDGANLNSQIAWLRCGDDLLPEYLFHFLQSQEMRNHFLQTKSGAALQQFTITMIKSVLISFPSISEQKRIVAILNEAFSGISQAVANAEKNLANARELFESYLNNVFTQKGEEVEEKILSDVCELISGQHIDAKDYNTNKKGIGYLTGPSDFRCINPVVTKWTEHPKRKALQDDILITVKGSGVGKINLLSIAEVAISRQLMAVRAKGAVTKFLYFFLSRKFSYFQDLANGAAIPGISRPDVLGLQISIPSIKEQAQIVKQIEEFQFEVECLESIYQKKLTALAELKQSILQKVFAGELTAESALQQVAG